MKVYFEGASNAGGIKIYSFYPEIDYQTLGYSIFEKWKWFGTVVWGMLGFFLAFSATQGIFFLWIRISIIVFILICVRKSQWHSLEHKIIFVLEHKEEISIDALKAAPVKDECCGSGNRFLLPPYLRLLRVGEEIAQEIAFEVQRKKE